MHVTVYTVLRALLRSSPHTPPQIHPATKHNSKHPQHKRSKPPAPTNCTQTDVLWLPLAQTTTRDPRYKRLLILKNRTLRHSMRTQQRSHSITGRSENTSPPQTSQTPSKHHNDQNVPQNTYATRIHTVAELATTVQTNPIYEFLTCE